MKSIILHMNILLYIATHLRDLSVSVHKDVPYSVLWPYNFLLYESDIFTKLVS